MQAHYGGSPKGWLHLPLAVLDAYMLMLPRLQAEAALSHVVELGVGTGAMEKHDRREAIGTWQRLARGPRSETFSDLSREERHAVLAGMGIEVEDG